MNLVFITLVTEFVFHRRFRAILVMKIIPNSMFSSGLEIQYSSYNDNLASGGPPNVVMEVIPLSAY